MAFEQAPKKTESDLVRKASQGDRQAASELFRRYEGPVFRRTASMVGNDQIAKEITQETMLAAWKAFQDGRYEPRESAKFTTWLFGIAKRKIIDHGRRAHVKRERTPIDKIREPRNLDADPEMRSWLNERSVNLQAAVDQLSPLRKKVIQLYYFEDMSAPEIARALGKSVNSVKQSIFRGKDDLKDIVKRQAA